MSKPVSAAAEKSYDADAVVSPRKRAAQCNAAAEEKWRRHTPYLQNLTNYRIFYLITLKSVIWIIRIKLLWFALQLLIW